MVNKNDPELQANNHLPNKVKLAICLLSCFLLLSLSACFKTNKTVTQPLEEISAESNANSSLGTANNNEVNEWLIPLISEYLIDDESPTVSGDPNEPNNSQAQATDLGTIDSSSNTETCSIGAVISTTTDVDWFKFTIDHPIDQSGFYFVKTKAKTLIPSSTLDTFIDVDGVDTNNDDGTTTDSELYLTLTPGTYYVNVSAFNQATTGEFDLCVNLGVLMPSSDPNEPNNVKANATDLGTIDSSSNTPTCSTDAMISTTVDVDWFSFTIDHPVNNTGYYFVKTKAKTLMPSSTLDTYIDVDSVATNNNDGTTTDSELYLTLTPGTYYVNVSAFNQATTGEFDLCVNLGILEPTGDPYEPNNTLAESEAITLDFCSQGALFAPNATDEDWYSFTLTQTQQVEIDLDAATLVPASAMDTTLTLYDSTGTQVAFNDDSGGILDSFLSLSLDAGTYYVKAKEFGNYSAVGPYTYKICVSATEIDTSYSIDLEFSGEGFTAARQQVFQDSAALWATAIVGDVSNQIVGSNWTDCDNNPYTITTVDDLYIQAKIAYIDGPGGTLGSAGPRYVRQSANELEIPITGCMTFDSADIAAMEADGTFQGVILHEMGHVLGIGTVWNETNNTNCPTNFAFTGANAVTEWNTLGGTGILPVEDGGGLGTRCGHWDEETFTTELMTGYVDSVMQMSRLTIASLKDLQYVVDFSAADPYSLCTTNCGARPRSDFTGAWEQLLRPRPIPEAAPLDKKK